MSGIGAVGYSVVRQVRRDEVRCGAMRSGMVRISRYRKARQG